MNWEVVADKPELVMLHTSNGPYTSIWEFIHDFVVWLLDPEFLHSPNRRVTVSPNERAGVLCYLLEWEGSQDLRFVTAAVNMRSLWVSNAAIAACSLECRILMEDFHMATEARLWEILERADAELAGERTLNLRKAHNVLGS